MKRILQICIVVALGMAVSSCGGNSSLDNTEAAVVLTVEIEEYSPDIDICIFLSGGFDIFIDEMTIMSNPKDPDATLGTNQDVNLTRWVMTPVRTDGGSEDSPQWSHDLGVFVPADGDANLENYRVYPFEFLDETPLSYLLPENGGVDPETGNRNIRQSIWLQVFGRTVSGKAVSTQPVPIAFNFFCGSP
jgi:hypothetical protein